MLSAKTEKFLSGRRPNEKQQEFFDAHADVWDEINRNDPKKLDYIIGLLELNGDETILDVGTGTGVMIPYYLETLKEGSVTALDYSKRMIEKASSKYPPSAKLRYVVSDVYKLPSMNGFDVAVCYSCFPHFPDPLRALVTISETLKKGGRLMIAHSSSRDHINNVHSHGGEEISNDYLPEIGIMSELFVESGLETEFTRDDDEYYIIIGSKS